MLEDLKKTVSRRRAERLEQELDLLHRSIERSFFEPADRVRADTSDSQGMGGTRQV